jgi:hypothetical protein
MEPTMFAPVAKEVIRVGVKWAREKQATELQNRIATGTVSSNPDVGLSRNLRRSTKQVMQFLDASAGTEWANLGIEEANAAVGAATRTIRLVDLRPKQLVEENLDAQRVLRRLGPKKHQILKEAALSEAARELYEKLVASAVDVLIAYVVDLDVVRRYERVETLSRLEVLVKQARQTASAVSELRDRQNLEQDRFLNTFRNAVKSRFGSVELYGVPLRTGTRRYPLSTAYISLRATQTRHGRRGVHAEDTVRADEIPAVGPRVLILGEAGSGKTTLLHWLMLTRSSEKSHQTPVYLALRSHYDNLPSPEEMIGCVTPTLRGASPNGWLTDQFVTGRGLLLIDGVDEVPRQRRADVLRWLTEFSGAYPRASILLTSRPAEGLDLLGDDFQVFSVEPMTYDEIEDFSLHWHESRALVDGVKYSDSQYQERCSSFLLSVRSNEALFSLARSPLLSAIMCALNEESRAKLPRDRMELYRMAIDMLIWRRDSERQTADELARLGYRQREILLRDLAYWMLSNEFLDTSREDAIERIRRKIFTLSNVDLEAPEVYRILLERCGLLREEIPGRVSFVHRTFQEYLAGFEAMDNDMVGDVLRAAKSESMREFVVLAAGHGNRRQRAMLIDGLLDSADIRATSRKRLRALAVACLESSPDLDPQVRSRVARAVETLTPPRTFNQASDLVRALGGEAVPLLSGWHQKDSGTVAAVVRALGLIGTKSALGALAEYGSDNRGEVVSELIRCWTRFDQGAFAAIVMSENMLLEGTAVLPLSCLTALLNVPHKATSFSLGVDAGQLNDVPTEAIPKIVRLSIRIRDGQRPADLSRLADLEALQRLEISGGDASREDLSPIASCTATDVRLGPFSSVSWAQLFPLSEATSVTLAGSDFLEIGKVHLPAVRRLAIADHRGPLDVTVSGLRDLTVTNASNNRPVRVSGEAAGTLRSLSLNSGCVTLGQSLPLLEKVVMHGRSNLNVKSLAMMDAVRHVQVGDCEVFDCSSLPRNCSRISFARVRELADPEVLMDRPFLATVEVDSCNFGWEAMRTLRALADSSLPRAEGLAPLSREVLIDGRPFVDKEPRRGNKRPRR